MFIGSLLDKPRSLTKSKINRTRTIISYIEELKEDDDKDPKSSADKDLTVELLVDKSVEEDKNKKSAFDE